MSKSITSYWPMSTPMRKSQQIVLDWIEKQPSHIKYFIAEMPVGSGKSPVGINFSSYFSALAGTSPAGNGIVFTPQKILQKQYETTFNNQVAGLYGKNNYTCMLKNTSCDIGTLVKPECPDCPHAKALEKADACGNAVLSYRLGLLHALLKSRLIRKKKIFILDECHTLENHLTEFSSINISERTCKKYNVLFRKPKTIYDALSFLETDYLPALNAWIELMRPAIERTISIAEYRPDSLSKSDMESILEFEEVIKSSELIINLLAQSENKDITKEYALITEKAYFKFKELFGRRVFSKLLDEKAEKMLFMSSTILDHKAFCADLGIDVANAAFISVDSEFSNEHRPVFFMPRAKMTFGWDLPERKSDREKMISAIKMLLTENHCDDNGIIHTGSFQIANWLVKELANIDTHIIYHHGEEGEETRDVVIDKFQNDETDKPKVLISPSITEGLDLVGDKGRFAIFAKVPYLQLGDSWVKGRLNLSQEWYNRQAMIAIIQGAGRVVRGPDDWGYTYILDESFELLYSKMENKIPKWWKDAYEKV